MTVAASAEAELIGLSLISGSQAIFRFARPVAFQGLPQSALPPDSRTPIHLAFRGFAMERGR